MMRKISQVLLGSSLLLVAMVAIAGQQTKPASEAQYPQCQEGASGASAAARDAKQGRRSVQNVTEGTDGNSAARIEEYLSFHTQVIEDKGKFSLMPWSGLRTHAN